jgi:hypothetical protein
MEMETKHTHLESDLSVAAYLLAKGYQLEGLELLGSRYAFKFADDGSATRAVQEFNKGGMVVCWLSLKWRGDVFR